VRQCQTTQVVTAVIAAVDVVITATREGRILNVTVNGSVSVSVSVTENSSANAITTITATATDVVTTTMRVLMTEIESHIVIAMSDS